MKPLLLSCLLALSCATPLQRLTTAIETEPLHWWGYVPPTTATLEDLQLRLRQAARYLNVRITTGHFENGAFGQFDHMTRTVILSESLPFDAQVQVAAHELCHALQPPGLIDQAEREVFADACAYLVVLPDRDDLPIFSRYLGRYRVKAGAVIRAFANEIRWAALVLRLEAPRVSLED